MTDKILQVFHSTHRELRPGASIPELTIEFFPFANITNTIRLRQGKLRVRLSDLLEGAPECVLQAIAHILLAKMYRKKIEREHSSRYRRYVSGQDISARAHRLRQVRGRKHIESAQGHVYNLESIFDKLNGRLFHGLLARPQITWSRNRSRNRLGHYDPAHNAIVVSRIFDDHRVPSCALEYIVYHEMLHLRHPVKLRGSRRCIHSAEFQADEKLFSELQSAKLFLKQISTIQKLTGGG